MKSVYTFRDFQLVTEEQILRRVGDEEAEMVVLKPRIFELLLIFLRHSERILTKEFLITEVWKDSYVDEHNLAVNVHLLRQILGDDAKENSYIETIPRRGYRFLPEVSEISANVEDQSFLQTKNLSLNKDNHSSEPSVSTIALLPFSTISSVRADEYLGIGISQTLTARLGGLGKIVTCSKGIVLKLGGRDYDLQAVGEKLQADFVVDGSARKIGRQLRVTAQIVRVADGAILWSKVFDDEFKSILQIEDEISSQLANALLLNLNGERKSPEIRPTESAEAYQYYLKGRFCLEKRSVGDFEKAVAYFQKAIEIDDRYALAYAGLADAYNLLISYGLSPREESIEKIETAAAKALELDPALAQPHATLGHLKFFQFFEFNEAEKDFRKAVELDPNYTNALLWFAILQRVCGQMDESLATLRRARKIEPLSFVVNTAIGAHFYHTRRYDEAIQQLREIIQLDENYPGAHFYLAHCLERLRRYEEAVAHYEKAYAGLNSDPDVLGYLAFLYAETGQTEWAKESLAEIKLLTAHRIINHAVVLALIYGALGDNDQAFEWLEKALENRVIEITIINFEPKFDCLRSDVRFKTLERKLSAITSHNP